MNINVEITDSSRKEAKKEDNSVNLTSLVKQKGC